MTRTAETVKLVVKNGIVQTIAVGGKDYNLSVGGTDYVDAAYQRASKKLAELMLAYGDDPIVLAPAMLNGKVCSQILSENDTKAFHIEISGTDKNNKPVSGEASYKTMCDFLEATEKNARMKQKLVVAETDLPDGPNIGGANKPRIRTV